MKNLAIEKFAKIRISKSDVNRLDKDVAAALAVACYAVSEINLLQKLYVLSDHDFIEKEIPDLLNAYQKTFILRTWSAKIFEFIDFFDTLKKSKIISISSLSSVSKNEAKRHTFVQHIANAFSRDLRHEATNHYSFSAARKNMGHLSEKSDFSFFLHEMQGNCFFLFGEEVMFAGRLRRHVNSNIQTDERKLYGDWFEWNLVVTEWIRQFHLDLVDETIMPILSEKYHRSSNQWLPSEMVGEIGTALIPFVIRSNKPSKGNS